MRRILGVFALLLFSFGLNRPALQVTGTLMYQAVLGRLVSCSERQVFLTLLN